MMHEEMSCRGTVTHIRRAPKRHVFRYPVWMLYVQLERTDAPPALQRSFLASVDRGHLMTPGEVRMKLAAAGLPCAKKRMRFFALTQPRSLGISFNPVNFYFCFVEGRLAALLADINNTPWNERHCYVLLPSASDRERGRQSFHFAKRFHVSPFLPMDGHYVLRLKLSDDSLRIAMRFHGGDAPFSACLSLHTRPLTHLETLRCAVRRPGQSALTLARIYWQAGRLFLKRAPFHTHPDKRGESAQAKVETVRKRKETPVADLNGRTAAHTCGSQR